MMKKDESFVSASCGATGTSALRPTQQQWQLLFFEELSGRRTVVNNFCLLFAEVY
jgi:hypothetical protein